MRILEQPRHCLHSLRCKKVILKNTPTDVGVINLDVDFYSLLGYNKFMMIFTTPGKSKKRKQTAAQRELQAEWDRMLDKYKPKKVVAPATEYKQPKPYIRETAKIPSLNSVGGSTALKPSPVYTGDKLMGIGTMHKSNSVPIFSNQEAKEIATMRRG